MRFARSSTDSFDCRCSTTQICSSRIEDISEACEASDTLSCGCPPGLRRNRTSSRAASCARAPAVLLHPAEGEIDPGRDSGARIDVAVLHPERLVLDLDVRIPRSQLAAEPPVSRRPPA